MPRKVVDWVLFPYLGECGRPSDLIVEVVC